MSNPLAVLSNWNRSKVGESNTEPTYCELFIVNIPGLLDGDRLRWAVLRNRLSRLGNSKTLSLTVLHFAGQPFPLPY